MDLFRALDIGVVRPPLIGVLERPGNDGEEGEVSRFLRGLDGGEDGMDGGEGRL